MDEHVRDGTTTILSYNEFEHVLLLGEAVFSFARAFAKEFSYNNKGHYSNNNKDEEKYNVDNFHLSSIDPSDSKKQQQQQTDPGVSSSSSSSSTAKTTRQQKRRMQITATEYGDGDDVANRYFNGDHNRVSDAINSLLELDTMKEIICGLNARNLGQADSNAKKTKNSFDRQNNCEQNDSDNDNDNDNDNYEKEQNERIENNGQNVDLGTKTIVCPCQRWNVKLSKWDDKSSFWNNNNNDWNIKDEEELQNQKYDLIIFNFPHSNQAGRATKLVKALFKQLRICIDDHGGGRVAQHVVLEMRLRTIETDSIQKRNVRSHYNHEEAAKECGFTCIGSWPGDLQRWEKLGYQHKMTKKNETCRDISLDCKVWRWKSL